MILPGRNCIIWSLSFCKRFDFERGREKTKQLSTLCGKIQFRGKLTPSVLLQGHSVTTKHTSDGKVDTLQTLHNLNEGLFCVGPFVGITLNGWVKESTDIVIFIR